MDQRLESRAAAEKEAYLVALAAYKRTPEYAAHQQYLVNLAWRLDLRVTTTCF